MGFGRALNPILRSAVRVQNLLQPLRRHGQLRHRAGHADGFVDGGGDRGAHAGDAALACPLDAERIERGGIVLTQEHFDRRRLAHRRHQVVRERGRERIAAFIVGELLEQRAAQALREAADDLPMHQGGIDGAPDVVSHRIALDRDAAGLAVDLHHREVEAVGIDLVLDAEPAVDGQAGIAVAQRLRRGLEMPGDLAQADRGTRRLILAHDIAVDDVERLGRGLQELGRHVERLGAQLDRAVVGGGGGHHGGARRVRADAEGDAVGLAVGHPHLAIIDADPFGADLRHHGLEALADRRAARDQLDRARRVDLDVHAIGGTEAALLDEHGKAGADRLAGRAPARQLGFELVPLERDQELVEQADIVAGVVVDLLAERLQRPVERHLLFGDGVAPPHVVGIDAELHRDRVDQPLAHERRLVAAGRPIRRRRRLVGQAEMPQGAVGGNTIGAGQDAGRHVHDTGRVGTHIGALVVEVAIVDCEDRAVGLDRRANAMQLLARVIGGDQVLAPVLDPLHGPAEPHRGDADQHVLRIELAADAEAAADMGLEHMDRGRRDAEHAREQLANAMGHLGRAVQLKQVAGGVVAADCTPCLQGHAGMAADGKLELDHDRRGAKHLVDIAVALADDRRLGVAAAGELPRLVGRRHHDRQFLDLDRDQIGGVLGHVGVGRKHRRHRIADVAHLVGCEHRLAVRRQRRDAALAEIDRRHVGDVGRGPHRDHARQRARRGRIDREDAPVRMV